MGPNSETPPTGNQVTMTAQGNLRAGQVAGGDIHNVRKRTIRIGLAGLALITVVGGGSAIILNSVSESTTVYLPGMDSDDVADVGAESDDTGAAETARIFLQAAVAGDAATACQLVSTETRTRSFALTGCEQTVLNYANLLESRNSPTEMRQGTDALTAARTTVELRGAATAEVEVSAEGNSPILVRVVRENDRWRVTSTSISALRMDLDAD